MICPSIRHEVCRFYYAYLEEYVCIRILQSADVHAKAHPQNE